MKIATITVHAGRTFNHPHEQYSNLRPEVTMTATLEESDDPDVCAKVLQQRAESLVEDHKQAMLTSLDEIHDMKVAEQELAELGRTINRQQARINELRKEHPQLALGGE